MRLLVEKKLIGRYFYRYFLLLVAVFLSFSLYYGIGDAAFTPQINYQGKLTDSSGVTIPDDNYNMRFRLCADSNCSSVLMDESWTTSNRVPVTNGLFSVMLGSISSLDGVDFNQDLYLEVSVGGPGVMPSWETMLPRKRLGSVPNAFNSDMVDGFHASTTAVANNLPVLDSDAGLTINGVTSTAGLYVSGNATTTGVLYGGPGSYFGDTNGNYWKTEVWNSPVGNLAILRGSSIDGTEPIGGIWNGLYVVGGNDNPVIALFDSNDFNSAVAMAYVTSSDVLLFMGAGGGYGFIDGPLINQSDSSGLIFANSDGGIRSEISFGTTTDAMNFINASGGYLFDGDIGVNTTTPSANLAVSGDIFSEQLFVTTTGNYTASFGTSRNIGQYNFWNTEIIAGGFGVVTTTDTSSSYIPIGLYGEGAIGIMGSTNNSDGGIGVIGFASSTEGIAGAFVDTLEEGNTGVLFGDSTGLIAQSMTGVGARIMTSNGIAGLVVGNSSSTGYSIFSVGGTNIFVDNVGIGTTTPSEKLSIDDGSIDSRRTYTSSSFDYSTIFKSGANLPEDYLGVGSPEFVVSVLAESTSTDYAASGGIYTAGMTGIGDYGVIGFSNRLTAGIFVGSGDAQGLGIVTENGDGLTVSTDNGWYALDIVNSSSTQYAIYSDGGMNYFRDYVGIGVEPNTTSGYILSVSGNSYFNGSVTTTGDLVVSGGINLGGAYRTSWPVGGGDGAFWTTSTNGLVGSPTLGPGHAIVVGASSYPAATSSDVSFEVVGNAKIGGKFEVTATSTLATTSMSFNSVITDSSSTIQFQNKLVSNGSFFDGMYLNFIDSYSDILGIGVNEGIGILASQSNPAIFFSAESTANIGVMIHETSSNSLIFTVLGPGFFSDPIGYSDVAFGADNLRISSNNNPNLYFGAVSSPVNAYINFNTSTDVLSFKDASGGYSFDSNVSTTGDFEVASGKGITLGGVYRTSWPTGGSGGDSFWQTSTNSLVGFPQLDSGYAIVIGSNVTTTDNVKLEVVGNTKLGGNLEITGNATTSGAQSVGSLRINSESFTDLTGLGLINDSGSLRVATTSLGLLTTNVAEGSNLYWTDSRFDTRLSATTSLPNLNVLTGLATIGSSSATTTIGGRLSVSGNSSFNTIIAGTWNGSTIGVSHGGTGTTTLTTNGILYGNGTNAVQVTAAGTNNYLLYSNAGIPAWTNAPTISGANITSLSASNISAGTLAVARGGTGWGVLTAGYLLVGNGTSAINTSTNLYWDNTNSRLSLGAGTSPARRLEIRDSVNAQLRISNASDLYLELNVNSSDVATFNMVGNSGVNPDVIAFSDIFGATAGSVSAPGISFSSDLNTGIYRVTVDTMGIVTGGSERLRVDSSGYVMIGTTTATNLFTVGATGSFSVDSTGNITSIRNVATNWPSTQGASGTFLQNDGAGNLTWATSSGSSIGYGTTYSVPFYSSTGTSITSTNGLYFYTNIFGSSYGSLQIGSQDLSNINGTLVTRNINSGYLGNLIYDGLDTSISEGFGTILVNASGYDGGDVYMSNGGDASNGLFGGGAYQGGDAGSIYMAQGGEGISGGSDGSDGSVFIGSTLSTGLKNAKLLVMGSIGVNTTTPGYKISVFADSNGTDGINVINPNSGSSAVSWVGAANGYAVQDAIRMVAYGSGVANNGAAKQDGAELRVGPNLSGLSITTVNTTGDIRFYTGGSADANQRLTIKYDGKVGVGTTTPASILHVYSSTPILSVDAVVNTNPGIEFKEENSRKWYIYNDNTNDRLYVVGSTSTGVYLVPGGTSWTASSDIRLKENVTKITNALQRVLTLNAYTYNFRGNNKTEIGMIAQEVQPQFSELVETGGEFLGLNYDRIGPILVEAIKEQQVQIDSLSTRITTSSDNLSVSTINQQFDSLSVSSVATFYGTITVVGEAGFQSKVVFKDHIYTDKDSAGVAKILAGATSTQVVFTKPYEVIPIINLTPKSNLAGINLWVENEATSSFVIAISQALDHDLEINWQAVAVWDQSDPNPVIESTIIDPEPSSSMPIINIGSGIDSSEESGSYLSGSTTTIELPPVTTGDSFDNSSSSDNINNSSNDTMSNQPDNLNTDPIVSNPVITDNPVPVINDTVQTPAETPAPVETPTETINIPPVTGE